MPLQPLLDTDCVASEEEKKETDEHHLKRGTVVDERGDKTVEDPDAVMASSEASTAQEKADRDNEQENEVKGTSKEAPEAVEKVEPSSKPNRHKSKSRRTNPNRWFVVCLRSLLLDIPLALLFLAFLIVYGIRQVHDTYYVPLLERARREDADLLEEFTYYERSCTEYDLSTRNLQDLLVNETAPIEDTLQQMMIHGGTVIPKVLSDTSVKKLRAYIVARNAAIRDAEVYPVSQGEGRLSYGIDATEDPAVSTAIAEIVSHPRVRQTLQALLGDDDFASAEITAIMAYPGAGDQVWHQDTKADGNAIKYARTYSHSYSLFVPLQDTTADMGPTDIAPGTHYCTNDLENMCLLNGMGLNEASSDHLLHAGTGALLNQHVWHRGSAHVDPDAPERVVFILSFLARPSVNDPRQLSRGTYFHQKWLMWGHTLKDLLNPELSMRRPFSILRCLSLWKPSSYHWGYDLVTSGFMRIANEQLEEDDLEARFIPRLDQIHFPKWLRGRYLEDEYSQLVQWRIFLDETISKTLQFVKDVTVYVHVAYLVLVLIACAWAIKRRRAGGRLLGRIVFRLTLTHGVLLLLFFETLHRIRVSEWGTSVLNGKNLMRPFAPVSIPRDEEALWASTGRTTLPQRSDVLLGTRYNAKFLGSYDQWLDYHPGNTVFLKAVADRAPLYPSYASLEPIFVQRLIQDVMEAVSLNDGRFLEQDYRTGVWRMLSEDVAREVARTELVAASNEVVFGLRREIDYQIADLRYGDLRGTALSRLSQIFLWHLRKRLLGSSDVSSPSKTDSSSSSPSLSRSFSWKAKDTLPKVPRKSAPFIPASQRFSLPPFEQDFCRVGALVSCYYDEDDAYYPGVIVRDHGDGHSFNVAFLDDSYEAGVDRSRLKPYEPPIQGQHVVACPESYNGECFPGTILRVMPSGDVTVVYDDGDVDTRVPSSQYYLD